MSALALIVALSTTTQLCLTASQVEDVITQVTRRDQLPAGNRTAPYPKATEQDGVDSRITWKTKLRSLLCCLAPPQNDQYFRSNEAEAVVIRPPRAAVPPPRAPGDCNAFATKAPSCAVHAHQSIIMCSPCTPSITMCTSCTWKNLTSC